MRNIKKKLLVLGTGKDQVPGILKAREKGYFTYGLDMDVYSEGAKLTDRFSPVNIKNVDNVKEFCKNNKNFNFDGVIAFGVDIPDIIFEASNTLGCYTPISKSAAYNSSNKLKAKEKMVEHKVNLPKFQGIENLNQLYDFIDKFGLPVILKPVDNSASRGVVQIHSKEDAKKLFNISFDSVVNKEDEIPLIAETYIHGKQLSTESILYNGKLYTIGIADRNYSLIDKFKPYIIENGGDLPPKLEGFENYSKLIEKIDNELYKVVKSFNIKNAVVKGDLVINNKEIFVIEVALRLSGGHFSTIEIPLSTGVDFLSYAIDIYLGNKIDTTNLKFQIKNFVKLRYFLEEINLNYKVKNLYLPNVENVIADFYLKEGDFVKGFSSKLNLPVNKIGYYIAYAKSKKKLEMLEKNFLEKVKIEKEIEKWKKVT